MKNRTFVIVAIFAVLAGMTGIAAADPCPAPNSWGGFKSDDQVSIFESLGANNLATYVAQAMNKNPIGGVPGIKEVCVASSTSHTSETALWDSWSAKTTLEGFVQFSDGGDAHNIPMDGIKHDVGTIQFEAPPADVQYLVHISDAVECDELYGGNPGTCFVKPAVNTPPVPELSTIVLFSAGLFGLVLVSRKYKN